MTQANDERAARKEYIRRRQKTVFSIVGAVMVVAMVVSLLFFFHVGGLGNVKSAAVQPNYGQQAPCPIKEADGNKAKYVENRNITLRVLNGTKFSGFAKAVSDALQNREFNPQTPDNYTKKVDRTMIVFGNDCSVPIERYKDEQVLLDDLAAAYQKAVKAFYAAGCRYLQLDDTSWGEFCSAEKRKAYAERGIDVDEVGRKYVYVLNKILEAKPEDMVITMHICRGNFRSTWSSTGGYEPVAEILFGHCNVDGFFLEYDSDRAGGFEPLRYIGKQKVVLGLVTSKDAKLENKEDVIARIREASKYVPLEQLALSPQCGFASTEEGNLVTDADQWSKLALVKEIAEEVWAD